MPPLEWYQIVAPILVCAAFAALAVRMERYRFVMIGLVAMVGYAMIQDQISARLCPEYFTVFHPPIPGLTDPTLLGISWGFIGAWWGGILLGFCAALSATVGSRPKLTPRELVRPMLFLLCVVATVTAITGFNVRHHAKLLGVSLDPVTGAALPPEHHLGLLTVACYHFAAYVSATLGGVVLCVWVWRERGKRATS